MAAADLARRTDSPTREAADSAAAPASASTLKTQLRRADYATGAAMLAPVQMATMRVPIQADPADVAQTAKAGLEGGGAEIPFRAEMEAAFDTSFSDVTAHFGPKAAAACAQVGARAYATGNSIAFAEASPDKELVAHELAHVVQQREGRGPSGGVGTPGDSFEQEADAMAARVVAGGKAKGEGKGPDAKADAGGAGGAVQMATDKSWTGHCVVHVDPVPDLVYEKASYWNSSKVIYTKITMGHLIGGPYEYLAKYHPFKKLGGCDWEGRKAGGGTNITHDRLKSRPADSDYSTYTHAIGNTVGRNCKAEEHFKAYRLVQSAKEKGSTVAPSFNHAIPIQSDGTAAIDFSMSADSISGMGFSLTDSVSDTSHVSETSSSGGGLDLGVLAAKVAGEKTAGEAITEAISSTRSYSATRTKTESQSTPIPAGAPVNKLAIPKLRTTTWELTTIPSDKRGVKTGGPQTRYVNHIVPTGDYDLIDAAGKADPGPARCPLPSSQLDKAYKQHEKQKGARQAGTMSALVKSYRLVDRKHAVRDLSAQRFTTIDGPSSGDPISVVRGRALSAVVNEGLTFSKDRSTVHSINRKLSAEIGVGDDASKATGISGAVGGAVESGAQVVQAVSEQLSQSHAHSTTISDSRKFEVPAGKTLVAALTPLVRVSTYGFELVNGKVVHVNRFNYQPTRHTQSKLADKGEQVDTSKPWPV